MTMANKILLNALTEADKKVMTYWVNQYAGGSAKKGPRADIETLLKVWSKEKRALYEMFGEKLILTREVSIEKPAKIMKEEIQASLSGNGSEELKGMKAFANEVMKIYYSDRANSYSELPWEFTQLIGPRTLAHNEYVGMNFEIPLPDGKTIKVQNGTKPMRVLAKVAQAFNLKGFEEFRLTHSRILNQKRLKGELCLSIHPMDYMTMSDNDSNWESCMSWVNEGCYRRGTVEMMNSECVVVAYLKAKTDMAIGNGMEWNNKKWRMLFIVDKQCVAGVKGYPFRNDELTNICIDWLVEMAEERNNWKFQEKNICYEYYNRIGDEENGYRVSFDTYDMYNDFDSCPHWIRISEHASKEIYVNYSGEANCMFCGGVHKSYDDDGDACMLACDDCYSLYSCDCCGDRYEVEELTSVANDDMVCKWCYQDYVRECEISGEEHIEGNLNKLYLTFTHNPDDKVFEAPIQFYRYNLQYSRELLKKYFTSEITPLKLFHPFNPDDCRWITEYYVTVDECQDAGLKLFHTNRNKINELIQDRKEKNSLIQLGLKKNN